jgi:hypothetical protein
VERISAEFDVIQISGCATIATSWRASDAVVRRDRGLAEERRGLSESEVRAAGSSVGPRRCDRPGEKETASPSSIHGQQTVVRYLFATSTHWRDMNGRRWHN